MFSKEKFVLLSLFVLLGTCFASSGHLTGIYPGLEVEYEFLETQVLVTEECASCTTQGEPINPLGASLPCCPEPGDKETVQLPNGYTDEISGIYRPATEVLFRVNEQPDPDCGLCWEQSRTGVITVEDISSSQGCPDLMQYTYFYFHPDDPSTFSYRGRTGEHSVLITPTKTANQPEPTNGYFEGEIDIPLVPGTVRVWSYPADCDGDQIKDSRTLEVSLYQFKDAGTASPATPTPYQESECQSDFDCEYSEACIDGQCEYYYDEDESCCGSAFVLLGGLAFVLLKIAV